jgi:hypothetical protein
LREKVKNQKTRKSKEHTNRSIELIQSMPRAKSSAHKKSLSKVNITKGGNFAAFRAFVGGTKFSGRGASSHRKT